MTRTAPLTSARGPIDRRSPSQTGASRAAGDIDFALAQRCGDGDRDALRLLAERHQQRVFGFLLRLLGSREDAEDAALEVFLRVWRQAGQFRGQASVSTWIYRIAANCASDILRRRVSQCVSAPLFDSASDCADPESLALANIDRDESAKSLAIALQSLRAEDRILLTLYYGEEKSCEEIAQIAQCARAALKMRLARARKRLRAAIERQEREEI